MISYKATPLKEKDPMRRIKGAQAKRDGEYLEQLVIQSCEYYDNIGIAHIAKTPEPMKVLRPIPGKPGRFEACFEKMAQPDFKGVLAGGQTIIFEAKFTDDQKISQDRVTTEQAADFGAYAELGAMAFVLVSFSFRSFYRVPWCVWCGMKTIYGRKYMTQDEMKPFMAPYIGTRIKFLYDQEGKTE